MEPTALAGGKKHLGDYEAIPGVSLPAVPQLCAQRNRDPSLGWSRFRCRESRYRL